MMVDLPGFPRSYKAGTYLGATSSIIVFAMHILITRSTPHVDAALGGATNNDTDAFFTECDNLSSDQRLATVGTAVYIMSFCTSVLALVLLTWNNIDWDILMMMRREIPIIFVGINCICRLVIDFMSARCLAVNYAFVYLGPMLYVLFCFALVLMDALHKKSRRVTIAVALIFIAVNVFNIYNLVSINVVKDYVFLDLFDGTIRLHANIVKRSIFVNNMMLLFSGASALRCCRRRERHHCTP